MTTRRKQTVPEGAHGNLSRRNTRTRNSSDIRVRASDISFTAPDQIQSASSAFTAAAGWATRQVVTVRGSGANSRTFEITARADGALTVTPAAIVTEAAGAAIEVRQNGPR